MLRLFFEDEDSDAVLAEGELRAALADANVADRGLLYEPVARNGDLADLKLLPRK